MNIPARVLTAALCMAAGPSLAADRAIIVLDASASMWGQIDGRPKLAIARETLASVLQSLPADRELGLMAYGHRQKGSCGDIELVVPPAAATADAITQAAASMKFLGKTPLTDAVRQAAEALRHTEDKATVVLITDGVETCAADPCALGRELEQSGVDFTAHVVGFGLSEQEGRQVACLAEATGGRYFDAKDAGALSEALTRIVIVAAPEPEPLPAPAPEPAAAEAPAYTLAPTAALSAEDDDLPESAGAAFEIFAAKADGAAGDPVATEYGRPKIALDPGAYVMRVRLGEASVDIPVTIEAGKVVTPRAVLNAGTLIIRPLASEGGEPVDGAAVVTDHPGEGDATTYGQSTIVVPAGEQVVTVTIGKGAVTETIAVAAGETVEKTIVVGVGRLVVNAFYVEGMKVEESGLAVRVVKAVKQADGSREDVTYGYGPDSGYDLPPGDYAAIARLGEAEAEAVVTVQAGASQEASVVLNAGVLAISAPGASSIEIFAAKKDIQGRRKSLDLAYGETHQTTLPAGDYVVVATMADGSATREMPVTVKAGERTEAGIQ